MNIRVYGTLPLLNLLVHNIFCYSFLTEAAPTNLTSEFLPTYEWQAVDSQRYTMPKGLEISAELKDKDSKMKGMVKARIPSQWTFRVWVPASDKRSHIRPGFARVTVRAATAIEQVVEGIAKRAGIEPDQIQLKLNRSSCFIGDQHTRIAVEENLSLPSSFSMDEVEALLNIPLRRNATVQGTNLFMIRNCVSLNVIEERPNDSVEAMAYIDAKSECLFSSSCLMRQQRLARCQQAYSVGECLWQLLLYDACTRVCLMMHEPEPVSLLPSDHLPPMSSLRSKHKSGHNAEMIPGANVWTRCERCILKDRKLVLFDPLRLNREDPEEQASIDIQDQLSIHGQTAMLSRHHPYMVLEMSSLTTAKIIPEPKAPDEGDSLRDDDPNIDDNKEGNINVEFLDEEDGSEDSQDLYEQYTCTRRFVRPSYIVSIWSVTNVFHLLWDLFFPMLSAQEGKVTRLAAHAEGAHLFLDVGHPDQRKYWHRLLRGDTSPSGDSPAGHVLKAFTGGLPVHSLAYLETLPGASCFEDLSMGGKYERGPLNHPMVMADNGFPQRSTLTKNSCTHSSTAAGREYLKKSRSKTAVSSNLEDMTMERRISMAQHDEILRLLPKEARKRRALLDMFGLGYPGYLPPHLMASGRRKIVFIHRTGSREILNMENLLRIAKERNEITMERSKLDVLQVQLENMPFQRQLELFRSTAILVAAHGQGAANTAFMPSRGTSALILAMPPGWFGWHWLYANTAVSVEVHAVVLQRATDGPIDGWSGKDTDRVNNVRDKKFYVDPNLFEDGLERAVQLVQASSNFRDPPFGVDVEYILGEERLDFSSKETAS